jgi:hypothetical protein
LHRGRVLNNEAVAEGVPELASFMIALRAGAVTWFEIFAAGSWSSSTRTGTLCHDALRPQERALAELTAAKGLRRCP